LILDFFPHCLADSVEIKNELPYIFGLPCDHLKAQVVPVLRREMFQVQYERKYKGKKKTGKQA
jgi:hypothetical protein